MYKRRLKIFMGLVAAGLLVLVARLAHLQIVRGQDFRHEIDRAMRNTELLPALRGRIMDRNGRILAIDQPCFDFCLDYRFITSDPDWVARQKRRIARAEKVDADEAAEIYQRRRMATWRTAVEASGSLADVEESAQTIVRRVRRVLKIVLDYRRRHNMDTEGFHIALEHEFHPVVTALDERRAVAIKRRIGRTVGAVVRPSHRRWYPYEDLACHLVGLTGEVSPEDQKTRNLPDDAPWLEQMLTNYLDGDPIGRRGVEKLCEPVLRGRRGYRRMSRDTGEVLARRPAAQGGDVHMTIDVDLQRRAKEIFRAQQPAANGAVVILSLPRREVLAAVSVPTFDLNTYRQEADELFRDNLNFVLRCRALTQLYPVGSTAKPVSAIAALSEGVISPAWTSRCDGYLFPQYRDRFRCWIAGRGAHGNLDVVGAIKHSCNIFFYRVGEAMERRRAGMLRDWFGLFGFLDPPGAGLPEERAGTIGTDLHVGEARMIAIGQGPSAATPMHVANAVATIASGGEFAAPTLVLEGGPDRVRRQLPVRPEHVRAVARGMHKVADEPGGTAYKYFHGGGVLPLGFGVAGKSGTAQTAPQRVDTNGDGVIDIVRDGNMAWFSGFAPYDDPRVAFAVVVEYVGEGGGSSVAGPIAREVLRACKDLGYVD